MITHKQPPVAQRAARKYLKFELDTHAMALVEKLATELELSPFKMCVRLLQERVKTKPGKKPDQ